LSRITAEAEGNGAINEFKNLKAEIRLFEKIGFEPGFKCLQQ